MQQLMTIPGTDGQKMSKSYGNIIDIFAPEKELLKTIKTIISDSTPLEDPKNPDTDTTFKLYSLLATPAETEQHARKIPGRRLRLRPRQKGSCTS